MPENTVEKKVDELDYKYVKKLVRSFAKKHEQFNEMVFQFLTHLSYTQTLEALELGVNLKLICYDGDGYRPVTEPPETDKNDEQPPIGSLGRNQLDVLMLAAKNPGISREDIYDTIKEDSVEENVSLFTDLIADGHLFYTKSFGCYTVIPEKKLKEAIEESEKPHSLYPSYFSNKFRE